MAEIEIQSSKANEEDTLKGKYLIFSMGKEQYGIEIRYITEIIGIQPLTEVPDMPKYVKSVTNLRGKIIPVIDARLRFGKEVRDYDDRTCIVVIDNNEIPMGLIVDSVSEVITIDDEDIVPPLDINKDGHKFMKGIGKAGGKVKLLLDCQMLLTNDVMKRTIA